jgi:hypothetical protein
MMAYYTALITAWNGATQPPAGVTGTALTGGMTTAQKLAAVNGWTIAGPAIPMVIPTYKIYNLIDPTEFSALTAANQQLVRDILGMGTIDGSPGTAVRARIVAIFTNASGATRVALAALAATYDSPQIPWATAPGGGGLNVMVQLSDVTAAGLS